MVLRWKRVLWVLLGLGMMTAGHAAVERVLSDGDWVDVRAQPIAETLPVTGTLSAVRAAWVHARIEAVASEVRVRSGSRVRRGEVLARFDAQTVTQRLHEQRANVTSTQARLALAQRRLDKQRVLFERQFISRLALEEFTAEVATLRAQLAAQQAQLAVIQQDVKNSEVRAPFDGVIAERQIEPGQLAVRNAQLFRVVDLSSLELTLPIAGREIARVREGQIVRFSVEGDAVVHAGRVARMSPVAAAGTRTVRVYVDVDNRHGGLREGQFAQGQLVLNAMEAGMALPVTALRDVRDQRAWVLAVDSQGRAVRRDVTLGVIDTVSGWAEVSTLTAGTRVIPPSVLGVEVGQKVVFPALKQSVNN